MNNISLKYLVSTRVTTGASESAQDYNPNDTRYIRISDFDEKGNIREDMRASISNEKAQNYLLQKNDILIAVTGGTVGKAMIFDIEEKSAYAGYLARIRTNSFLYYKYLWYFLNSPLFDKWRKESINVSTMENISSGKYANMHVPYHSIEKQKAISNLLDNKINSVDQLILNQEQQIEKLKEYKQSLIEWVLGKDVFDYSETKENILNNTKPISYICDIIRGNTPFKKDELSAEGDYVGLQYGKTYKTDVIDYSFMFFVDKRFYKEDQLVKKDDVILISTSETIEDLGHTCFYDRNDLGLLGGEQFVLKPKQEFIRGKYLYYCSLAFTKKLKKYSTGLKVYRFNSSHLKNIFINIPSLEIQDTIINKIDKKFNNIDRILKLKENKLEKLNDYKKSLIYEYVTGKKEV